VTDDGGRIVLGPASRELRRVMRPMEWVVLEDLALDARRDAAGALMAPTSARRVAEHLGLTPGAVARALARLRSAALVIHTRQVGPAGRFGPSVYLLGPIPGLEVVDEVDGTHGVAPLALPPQLLRTPIDRPRVVDGAMGGPAAAADEAADVVGSDRRSRHDDVAAATAAAVDDLRTEDRARSAARRGRRPVSQPGVVQLSFLEATEATEATRHP
jgi:hypothetical protein